MARLLFSSETTYGSLDNVFKHFKKLKSSQRDPPKGSEGTNLGIWGKETLVGFGLNM